MSGCLGRIFSRFEEEGKKLCDKRFQLSLLAKIQVFDFDLRQIYCHVCEIGKYHTQTQA